jgi:hypothetical protein
MDTFCTRMGPPSTGTSDAFGPLGFLGLVATDLTWSDLDIARTLMVSPLVPYAIKKIR